MEIDYYHEILVDSALNYFFSYLVIDDYHTVLVVRFVYFYDLHAQFVLVVYVFYNNCYHCVVWLFNGVFFDFIFFLYYRILFVNYLIVV